MRIVLNTETDFTLAALKDFLNEKYKQKSSGKRFNFRDIQGYVKRGKLPNQYGGNVIKVIENKEIGIKILRLKGL